MPGAAARRALQMRHSEHLLPFVRYKIAFIVVGLAGQYFTRCVPAPGARFRPADARQRRGLYTDSEVTYARRLKAGCPCCGGRLKPVNEEAHGDATKTG